MGGGWKIAAMLLLLAVIAAVIWGRQRDAEEEPARGVQPRIVTPDISSRPARERPGREREERPGSVSK